MLFGSWQLKTTICVLFLATCLGQEVFRACETDYCYEQSVERRATDPRDSNEWQNYRNGYLEREKSTRRDDSNKRINDNDEHDISEEARQNRRLFEETRRENSRAVEHRTISDVTRHLVDRVDERRVDTNRERLRRLDNRDNERRSDNNREEEKVLLRRFDERKVVRDITVHSEEREEERRANLRQISKLYLNRSTNDVERHFRSERESEQRRNENKRERNASRRSEDSRKEQPVSMSGLIDHEEHREIPRRYNSNREEQRDTLRRFDDVSRRFENKRERHELIAASNQVDDRYAPRTIVYRENNLRRFNDIQTEQESDRELKPMQRRVENKRERGVRHENERADYQEFQRDARTGLEDSREETLKPVDDSELLLENNRILKDLFDSHTVDEQLLQRKYELIGRHDKNKRDIERGDDGRESLHSVERHDLRERKIVQRRNTNKPEREERHRISNILEDRVIESRRSDATRESQRSITTDSRKEQESIQRGYKNNRNRQNRFEASRRFEDREVHTGDKRRLEDKHDERRLNDREVQRDVDRRREIKREDREKTLQRFYDHQVSQRSDDVRNSRYTHKRLSQEERVELRVAQREFSKRLESDNKEMPDGRDARIRSNVFREERYQIMRQLDRVEHRNVNNIEQVEHDITRNLRDNSESVHNDKRFEKERNVNRQVDRKRETRLHEQRLYQEQRDSEHTFIPKQRNTNSELIEEDYTQKPIVFLKKGYMVFGQGVLLAYVVMKTLNGKNDFKNQLPIKFREAMEIICF